MAYDSNKDLYSAFRTVVRPEFARVSKAELVVANALNDNMLVDDKYAVDTYVSVGGTVTGVPLTSPTETAVTLNVFAGLPLPFEFRRITALSAGCTIFKLGA